MATKKSASGAKKSSAKAGAAKTTRITTVKAVETGGSRRPVFASGLLEGRGGRLFGTPITGAALAEFIGAFLLATTILIIRNEPFFMFFGLVSIFMLIGGLSGAHVNPAVTVGAWVTKRIGWTRALSYIVAQILGAMLALVVMDAFLSQAPAVTDEAAALGRTAPQLFTALALPEGKEWTVLFAEMIGVAVLGFAYASILGTRVKDKVTGAFTVGGAAFVAMAFASTATEFVGASAILNPAVAITLKALDFQNIWTIAAYIVASLLGAVIGFFLYDLLRVTEE